MVVHAGGERYLSVQGRDKAVVRRIFRRGEGRSSQCFLVSAGIADKTLDEPEIAALALAERVVCPHVE